MSVAFIITNRVIELLEFLLFARAIMSWFPQMRDSAVAGFLYFITEPIIQPIRNVLNRIQLFRTMPIDFSVLGAFIFLALIRQLLFTFL